MGPWFDTFGAMAAIGRFAADAEDVQVSDLNPGEFHRRTSAVDARICLPAAWRGASVSAGASHHGERKATVEALPDGTLAVEVAFDSAVTRHLDGSLTVGELAVGAGVSDASRAGLTVAFAFDRATETPRAERILAASSASHLEILADEVPWAVVDYTVRTGEGAELSRDVGVGGVSIGTESAHSYDEAVSVGADGLDGTSFAGESTSGASATVGGVELGGLQGGSAFEARVEGGEVTGRVEHATSESWLGRPHFGITPQQWWPPSLLSVFQHGAERVFALDLSDHDIEQIVRVRPLNQGAWDACGFAAGRQAGQDWVALGEALRTIDPPDDWVHAAGFRVALLAAGVQLLAAFVGSHNASSWKALYAVTRRFGIATGEADQFEALGMIDYWPPGTEALEKHYDTALARKATLVADLDAAAATGEVEAGRALHHAVAHPLNALTVALPGLAASGPEARAWQADMLARLAEIRTEVEWEYEMFEQRIADGSPGTPPPGIDTQSREKWVLLGTLASYSKLEAGIFDEYRGRYESLTEFQRSIQPIYRPWRTTYERWRAIDPTADPSSVATPDWYGYAEVLDAMTSSLSKQEAEALQATSRREWSS